jgi:tRNA (mo5U34)-methyltransferase
LEDAVSIPVRYIPPAVEPEVSAFFDRRHFGVPEGSFVFLFCFDFNSSIDRKNPIAVLESFARVLPVVSRLDVRLVIKTNFSNDRPADYHRFIAAAARFGDRVIILDKTMSDSEAKSLIRCCNVFVSLHRSEGFGLGLAEAMYFGRPVIATAYSGNMDFMSPDNSCQVPYHLTPVPPDSYIGAAGQQWAEPDIEAAARSMAELALSPGIARAMGQRASTYMRTHHSIKASALGYREALIHLHGGDENWREMTKVWQRDRFPGGFLDGVMGAEMPPSALLASSVMAGESESLDQTVIAAVCAQRQGRFNDAERLYRTILAARPGHPGVNYNLGVMALQTGLVDVALACLRIPLISNPGCARHWLTYAYALLTWERVPAAQILLGEATRRNISGKLLDHLVATAARWVKPGVEGSQADDPGIQFSAAVAAFQSGQFDVAEAIFQGILARDDCDVDSLHHLGLIYRRRGQTDLALKLIDQALTLRPFDANAQVSLGTTCVRCGNLSGAEQAFRAAIAFRPDYPEALNNLGAVLEEQGRWDDARVAYLAALEVDEAYQKAVENLRRLSEVSRKLVDGGGVGHMTDDRPGAFRVDAGGTLTVSQQEVDRLQWWHSIDLGRGVVTKGQKALSLLKSEADIALRHGVEGKTVLDVGAWDGAFSFESKRRGASHVLATDYYCWLGPGLGKGKKECFELARCSLELDVIDMNIDVLDISPETTGIFDIVLFLGVLYHLKNPFLALEKMAAVTKSLLVVETETALDTLGRPAMAFFPGKELNNDPTNWWAPNIECVRYMLYDCGFKKVEVTPHPEALKQLNMDRGRFFFHAWK